MTKISTLADVAREGWQVFAHCNNEYCCRGRPLDIAALIRRFGGDHCVIDDIEITRRLRCECGHRDCMLRLRPPNKADFTMSSKVSSGG